jgi:hypothetical protein
VVVKKHRIDLQRLRDLGRTVLHSARLLVGRPFYLAALVPLLWPAFQALMLLSGGRQEDFRPESAQGTLLGFPLALLAIFLGVRVIAGEVDARRLEIAYTVPGGSHRVWLAKLLAGLGILLASEALLALVAFAFFTSFPLGGLYGALQAAMFYLVLAMGLAALFRSEVTGAMATVGILALNTFFPAVSRFSPFFNPVAFGDDDPAEILAFTIQNRIGFALLIAALTALAFTRAERREKMLAG